MNASRALRLALPLLLAAGALAAQAPGGACAPLGAEQRFAPEALFNHIDGGAELFLEFGFRELRLQKVRCGGAEIAVERYVMSDADAALGIYLLKCGREAPWPGLSFRNSGDRYQLTAVRGDCFLQVNNFGGDAAAEPAMAALAREALQPFADAPPSALPGLLPEAGRLPGTLTFMRGPYALQAVFTFGEGDALQLEGCRSAVAADYADGAGRPFTRLAADYGDEAAAAAVLRDLPGRFDATMTVLQAGPDHLLFRDFQGRYGRVRREGARLVCELKLADRPVD